MKGCAPRALTSWMARATSSLPVPDSPRTSTGAMLRATFSTSERTCCIALESPAMRPSAGLRGGGAGGGAGRAAAAATPADAVRKAGWPGRPSGAGAPPRPSAEATTARNCFRSTGLVR